MNFKVTRKEVQENFRKVYCVSFEQASELLSPCTRLGFNSGVYGWNFDVYDMGQISDELEGVAICTGYRNLFGKRLEYVDSYEKEAERIFSCNISYEEKKATVTKLLYGLLHDNDADTDLYSLG